jgi:hypothetical protein
VDPLSIGVTGKRSQLIDGKDESVLGMVTLPTLIPMSLSDARYFNSLFALGQPTDMSILCYHTADSLLNPSLNSFLGCTHKEQGIQTIQIRNRGDYSEESIQDICHYLGESMDSKVINFSVYDLLTSVHLESIRKSEGSTISFHVEYPHLTTLRSTPVNPSFVSLQVLYVSSHIDPDSHESTQFLRAQLENLEKCVHIMNITAEPIPSETITENIKEFLQGPFRLN